MSSKVKRIQDELPAMPPPHAVGTKYGRSKIAEVVGVDASDDYLPYLYKLYNGQQVWIPVDYHEPQEQYWEARDGCNCVDCRSARGEFVENEVEEDDDGSGDGDDYDEEDES